MGIKIYIYQKLNYIIPDNKQAAVYGKMLVFSAKKLSKGGWSYLNTGAVQEDFERRGVDITGIRPFSVTGNPQMQLKGRKVYFGPS